MSEILYIETSPRGERSYSIGVAQAFIETYQSLHPQDEIKTINLFKERLPAFDGDIINTKYAILHAQNPTTEQRAAWKPVEDLIHEFKGMDKYIFSIPMWNFGIPYRLKNYIDVLVQPTYTFTYSPEKGYEGLVTGKRAFIAYARGGAYGPETGFDTFDYQKRYMEAILAFIGITDVRSVVVENTLTKTRDEMREIHEAAKEQAREAAKSF